jgi:TPR repeat protein
MLFTAILLIALRQEQTGSAPQPSMTDVASLQAKAQVGDADAQVQLGQAYEGGSGVRRNDEEAAKWYRKAANQGNQAAEVAFGILLWTGRGVPEDKAQAVTWYRKAARQGNGSAMFNLGTAYYNGEGAPIDAVRALAWFLLAEDHGSSLSKDAVQRFEKTARPNEFEEAYALIARMYVVGDEVRQNYARAAKWYQKAAEKGNASAAVTLAGMYFDGRGEDKDGNAALHWCKFAADKGNPVGVYCVGRLYQEGAVGPKDAVTAIRWFKKGAAMGNAPSYYRLGQMYWDGDGVAADKVTAYKWTVLASMVLPEAGRDARSFRSAMTAGEIQKAEQQLHDYIKAHHLETVVRVDEP